MPRSPTVSRSTRLNYIATTLLPRFYERETYLTLRERLRNDLGVTIGCGAVACFTWSLFFCSHINFGPNVLVRKSQFAKDMKKIGLKRVDTVDASQFPIALAYVKRLTAVSKGKGRRDIQLSLSRHHGMFLARYAIVHRWLYL